MITYIPDFDIRYYLVLHVRRGQFLQDGGNGYYQYYNKLPTEVIL